MDRRSGTASHYERLSGAFDENWAYSPEFLRWMGSEIVAALRLGPADRIVDLGCGTGLFTRELLELVNPTKPVLAVDPSEGMLRQVPADPRIVPVRASAEQVASGEVELPGPRPDAVLVKEAIHHVQDSAAVLSGLAVRLAPGGRLLVVMLPTRIEYPLFRAALERFEQLQPDPELIAHQMRDAGLDASVSYEGFPLEFDTERYLGMVRSRYMSLLSTFADDEIEAGVAEIRAAHPEPRLSFTDRFAFVLGVRP